MPRHRYSGFTLVELLAVIAIISILSAIVMVGINKARATAGLAGCASNLRQTHVSMMAYVADNKGALPGPCWSTFGPYPNPADSKLLSTRLASYVLPAPLQSGVRPKVGIFSCPSWADEIPAEAQIDGRSYRLQTRVVLETGVAVNPYGYPEVGQSPAAAPLKYSLIPRPVQTYAIIDLDARNGGASYVGVPGTPLDPVHGGKRNALYFDGHVATEVAP